jgi:hypothetical protein
MSKHPYRWAAPREPSAFRDRSGGGLGQPIVVVQIVLLLLCGARLWSAAATGAIGFEAVLALVLFVALLAQIARMLRRRL